VANCGVGYRSGEKSGARRDTFSDRSSLRLAGRIAGQENKSAMTSGSR